MHVRFGTFFDGYTRPDASFASSGTCKAIFAIEVGANSCGELCPCQYKNGVRDLGSDILSWFASVAFIAAFKTTEAPSLNLSLAAFSKICVILRAYIKFHVLKSYLVSNMYAESFVVHFEISRVLENIQYIYK